MMLYYRGSLTIHRSQGAAMTKLDRRDFIKSTAAGALSAGIALRTNSASGRVLGANDRVVVGFIGLGRMGQSNLKDFQKQPDVDVAAVCDVYGPNLDKA